METFFHWFFGAVWLALATLFGLCGAFQVGWIG
jgi:hypothetical protein